MPLHVVIKDEQRFKKKEYNAIVISADPLQLHVMYWDVYASQRDTQFIHIESVVKELTELTLLEMPK